MSDLGASEQAHGRSPSGVFWLISSGWGKRQRSLDGDTPGDTDNLHFPGLAKQAAQFLIDQRRVKAVGGIDPPTIDQGVSQDFARQQIVAAANPASFADIANLDRLPATGATIYAMPMKSKGGSGAPLQIFAILP